MPNNTRRLIQGVGINNLPHVIKNCPYYERWKSILCRCYSKKFHERNQVYVGCSICEEWIYSLNFKHWMETQDWKGKVLDKDILFPGNKIYSPETCIFVPIEVNSLIIRPPSRDGFPLGVYQNQNSEKYYCAFRINGKKIPTKQQVSTKMEAHRVWQQHRAERILGVSERQNDDRLKGALIRIAESIIDDYVNNRETKYD